MYVELTATDKHLKSDLTITGSKSETNRLLILQALFSNLKIENQSDSDDSSVLQQALSAKNQKIIDIGHAGTAMRFLTAYFAFQKGERTLTGSPRMQNRPIKVLVEALRKLGADIQYLQQEGYPPLLIRGSNPTSNAVRIKADVSSQYISALLLIGASFPQGLKITLQGEVLSRPYIEMTLSLLKKVGVQNKFENNQITISPLTEIEAKTITIESDWSSASYFYSLAALSETAVLKLSHFKKNSLQGDAKIAKFFNKFGVSTYYKNDSILLKKEKNVELPSYFETDLSHYPDLAQTLAVTCLGLGISFKLKGLSTLRIKETDRLNALQSELSKFGAEIKIKKDILIGKARGTLNQNIKIDTYDDHRMAMAFAPLVLKTKITIQHPQVVSKSFPTYWKLLQRCNIEQVFQ
ncbi:MAG TPA: 3-phosphoshikimate 1-carboxyvinyltransferase [Flavobacteriaceae bacterium]|nr:3-phosphoshikimate 1-carboxyvinyltransferase [Flavobacteriaceae bacterium]